MIKQFKPKIYGFMHIAIMNNWQEVLVELLEQLTVYGLLEHTEEICFGTNCVNEKPFIERLSDNPKFNHFCHYPEKKIGENGTIKHLWDELRGFLRYARVCSQALSALAQQRIQIRFA